jgi:hypothetical protein
LVLAWWALWILMQLIAVAQFFVPANSLESMITSRWLGIATGAIALPAGILAILVVRAVDANQAARNRILQEEAASAKPEAGEPVMTWLGELG